MPLESHGYDTPAEQDVTNDRERDRGRAADDSLRPHRAHLRSVAYLVLGAMWLWPTVRVRRLGGRVAPRLDRLLL
jgi:hypothetical protein